MGKTNENAFAEFLADARGKIVFVLTTAFPQELSRAERFFFAGTGNYPTGKTFFETLAAPLAAAGTPWETAQKRIADELKFWLGNDSPEIANRTTSEGDEATQGRVALARALAAKPESAPLAVSATFLSREIFERLRERARGGNFAVVVFGKILPPPDVFDFDAVAICKTAENGENFLLQAGTAEEIFRNPASMTVARKIFAAHASEQNSGNVFSGKLIGAGAGEFLAEFAGKEIHGKLCGNAAEQDFPAGTPIEIFVRAENFHVDAFPPEENFFEVAECGNIAFDGRIFSREFRLPGEAGTLRAAALARQTLEIPVGSTVFLWFFPEDALGFPVDPAGI